MFGNNFPVADYYRQHIVDAITISRGGGWWTAILLIDDPNTNEPFINLYRWKQSGNAWKLDKSFPIKKKNIKAALEAINQFSNNIFHEERID